MTRGAVLAVWAVAVAALVLCEPLSLLTRGRTASLGGLLEQLVASRPALVAGFVAWMWLGWHLFAR